MGSRLEQVGSRKEGEKMGRKGKCESLSFYSGIMTVWVRVAIFYLPQTLTPSMGCTGFSHRYFDFDLFFSFPDSKVVIAALMFCSLYWLMYSPPTQSGRRTVWLSSTEASSPESRWACIKDPQTQAHSEWQWTDTIDLLSLDLKGCLMIQSYSYYMQIHQTALFLYPHSLHQLLY